MESYNLLEARAQLGRLVDEVRYTGRHILITRNNTPVAVIVPVEFSESAGDWQAAIARAEGES